MQSSAGLGKESALLAYLGRTLNNVLISGHESGHVTSFEFVLHIELVFYLKLP